MIFLGNNNNNNTSSNTVSSEAFSPLNVDIKQEMPPEKKRKIKSPSQDSILTVKAEPPWDLDSHHSVDKKFKVEYSIDMDAQTIIKSCK